MFIHMVICVVSWGTFYHFEEITVQRKNAWGNFYYVLEISKGKKLHVPRWLSLKIVIVTFAVEDNHQYYRQGRSSVPRKILLMN